MAENNPFSKLNADTSSSPVLDDSEKSLKRVDEFLCDTNSASNQNRGGNDDMDNLRDTMKIGDQNLKVEGDQVNRRGCVCEDRQSKDDSDKFPKPPAGSNMAAMTLPVLFSS